MSLETQRAMDSGREEQPRPLWKNDGEPTLNGYVHDGSRERKMQGEDVKIHDAQRGLFAVADGRDGEGGRFVSKEIGVAVSEKLGASLDRSIENIQEQNKIPPERRRELVFEAVESAVKGVLREVHDRINLHKLLGDVPRESSASTAVAKRVDIGDGTQKLFFVSVGDSRVYVQRGRELHRLTKDDSILQNLASRGEIGSQEVAAIDQANSYNRLDAASARIAHEVLHAEPTEMIGKGKKAEDLEVHVFDLKPGDRVVVTSKGVHGQLIDDEMRQILLASDSSKDAERRLQIQADMIGKEGKRERATGYDVSVVVDEVPVVKKREAVRLYTPEQARGWPDQIREVDESLRKARTWASESKKRADTLGHLKAIAWMNQLEQQRATLEYWIARAKVDAIDAQPQHVSLSEREQLNKKMDQLISDIDKFRKDGEFLQQARVREEAHALASEEIVFEEAA